MYIRDVTGNVIDYRLSWYDNYLCAVFENSIDSRIINSKGRRLNVLNRQSVGYLLNTKKIETIVSRAK